MAHQIKVATCCYCGSKTTLQLTARAGHELACGSCGAPLHEMKALKVGAKPEPRVVPQNKSKHRKPKKSKKRKPLWQKALGEVFDDVEDIFD